MSILSTFFPGFSFNHSVNEHLDAIFGSLADPTRRDILRRVSRKEMSIGEIAEPYDMSLAAISKHLKILEKAKLVIKRRFGKQQVVAISPTAFKDASAYLRHYEKFWNARLDTLERHLSTFPTSHGRKRS